MIATAFWKGEGNGIAPVIINNITSSIVNTTPVILTVTTIGDPTYIWKKDGDVIPGETGPSITISVGGTYTVDITNNSGTVTGGPAVITVSAEPYYYLNFIFTNNSRCNLSKVSSQILGYNNIIEDPNAILNSDSMFDYQTTTYSTTYQIGNTVFSKGFRDNCIADFYSGNSTLITNTTRYFYNAEYDEEIGDWICRTTEPIYGTANKSVTLDALASSIKTQYEADNTKGMSSGNPFIYQIYDI